MIVRRRQSMGVASLLLSFFSLVVWLVLSILFDFESEVVYRNSLTPSVEVVDFYEDGKVLLGTGEIVKPLEGYLQVGLNEEVRYSEEMGYLIIPMMIEEVIFRYVIYSISVLSLFIFMGLLSGDNWCLRLFWYIVFFLFNTYTYTMMDRGYIGNELVFWYFVAFYSIGIVLNSVIRFIVVLKNR